MQFPITRQYLKDFNRENVIAEKGKQKRYDLYRTLINIICNDIQSILINSKTPVTRYVWTKIGIIEQWKMLTNHPNSLNIIPTPIGVDPILYCDRMCHPSDLILKSETVTKYLPEFIDLLKDTFIDCDIIVDPLKTYLIIDWS